MTLDKRKARVMGQEAGFHGRPVGHPLWLAWKGVVTDCLPPETSLQMDIRETVCFNSR